MIVNCIQPLILATASNVHLVSMVWTIQKCEKVGCDLSGQDQARERGREGGREGGGIKAERGKEDGERSG